MSSARSISGHHDHNRAGSGSGPCGSTRSAEIGPTSDAEGRPSDSTAPREHRGPSAEGPTPALGDLIEAGPIQSLMDDFYRIAGIPMAVIDIAGNVLVAVGWQDVCTKFHRVHPESCRHCIESDTQLSAGVPAGEFRLYKCKNNMWDVATPIMIGDWHVGNVFAGQFFFEGEPLNRDLFRSQARAYGFDEQAYFAALDAVPRLSRAAVDAGMAFFSKLAQMLSHLGHANITLARSMAERDGLMQSLRESEEQLRNATRAADIGVWSWTPGTRDVKVSANWRKLFGVGPDAEVTFDTWVNALHPDDRDRAVAELNAASDQHREFDTEYRVVWPDGTIRWLVDRGRAWYDTSGHAVAMGGVNVDITGRKQAEEALCEADRRKGEFIAVLSHELRNPLAPIRYALPIIERENLDEHGARALEVINRQVQHLSRLVDDLLDVSRITRGKIELRRERITLGSVVSVAVEASSPAIVAARHRLNVTVPDEAIWLDADAARIAQVVTNLLNNAAKYTPGGGEIWIDAASDGTTATVRVRDNGIGIRHESLRSVFDMFRQLNGPDASEGGLGIGLALSKQLVELHGGTIEARSAGPGRGAEFLVHLPIANRNEQHRLSDPSGANAPGRRRLRVLIVDDNADLLEMVGIVVEALGHDVRKAIDGGSAVSVALSYRPDVVLLDLGLPTVSGIDVARELRRHPETADAHLVALTGWGQPEDRERTREAGFDHHLTKPAEPKRLERLLDDLARR